MFLGRIGIPRISFQLYQLFQRRGMGTVTLFPTEKHSASIIFLHGLGDTGYGWEEPMRMIQNAGNGHIKFILPSAAARPVTINQGMSMPAWFDIRGLSRLSQEDQEGLEESRALVEKLVAKEEKEGISSDKIIIGGFSQGAALAIYTTYLSNKPIAACLGLSGYVPFSVRFHQMISKQNKTTPLFMFHGDIDAMIPVEVGIKSCEILEKAGLPARIKTYQQLGHSACPEEIQDVTNIVKKILLPSTSKL